MRLAISAAAVALLAVLTASVVLFPVGHEPLPAVAAQPAADALPADLALVPADAFGFIHVRAAELWKNELLAPFRATFEKAGPKAIGTLDERFVPKPSTFDRVTAFLMLAGPRNEPVPFVVLRFNAPFDSDEVVRAYLPDAEKAVFGGKTVFASKKLDLAVHFPDKQHILIGIPEGFQVYLEHKMPANGPMSAGLKLAAAGRPIVGSVNLAALPPEALRELKDLPPEVQSLLKAEHLTASLDLAGTSAKVEVVAGYKNAAEAEGAEKAIKSLADYGRKELGKIKADIEKKLYDPKVKGTQPLETLPETLLSVFALGAINQLDELLANPGRFVKRNGAELTASVALPKELLITAGSFAALGVAALLPAVQKVRMAAARMNSLNNMKQIAIAFHAYHDAYGHFPRDITDKNGKPILSWRVAILPFLEQDNLYKQFKLDEPWDSENNKKWSQVAIKTYMSPRSDPPTPAGMTNYKAFAGPSTVFEPGQKLSFNSVTDGTSNTIMFVESGDPVAWAKPDDIPFDPKKALPKLTPLGDDGMMLVAMTDGSVRAINLKTVKPETLKAAITRNGGEILGADW